MMRELSPVSMGEEVRLVFVPNPFFVPERDTCARRTARDGTIDGRAMYLTMVAP